MLVPVGRLDLAASVVAPVVAVAPGDEANLLAPIEPATTVNFTAGYRLGRVTLTARVTNVFNTKPSRSACWARPTTCWATSFDDSRFLSPSAPRAAWIGVELRSR